MPDEGTLDIDRLDAGAVLALVGEHDLATAPTLRTALQEALEAGNVVVDLDRASFLDSTVLGVIIGGRDAARERGRSFVVLVGPAAQLPVRRLVELTGMGSLLDVVAEREAALGALRLAG